MDTGQDPVKNPYKVRLDSIQQITKVLSLKRNSILQSSRASFCSKLALAPLSSGDKKKGKPPAVREWSKP